MIDVRSALVFPNLRAAHRALSEEHALVVEQHDKNVDERDEEIRRLSAEAQHQATFIEALHVRCPLIARCMTQPCSASTSASTSPMPSRARPVPLPCPLVLFVSLGLHRIAGHSNGPLAAGVTDRHQASRGLDRRDGERRESSPRQERRADPGTRRGAGHERGGQDPAAVHDKQQPKELPRW